MQAVEIARAIISNNYTIDELNNIAGAIKFVRSQLTRRNTSAFVKGSRVAFVNTKTGVRFTGKVDKVKQKFVLVDTDVGVRYNVPASMLVAA
jgi:hypothetical protein